MGELAGKVAFVGGATRKRGLGRAIALCLARAGASVAVLGSPHGAASLTPDERESGWRGLASVADEIEGLGTATLAIQADITDAAQIAGAFDETVARLGRLDIVVNNAAFSRGADRVPLVDIDLGLWRRIVEVNLTGTVICCQAAARRLIEQGQGGSIVNISSYSALRGAARTAAYAASKAGVHAMSATLAEELGPHGITVNVVAPGMLDTARIDDLRQGDRWNERVAAIPLGRAGTAEEVAEMVRFLAGPHARWISGEVICPSGGEVRRAAR